MGLFLLRPVVFVLELPQFFEALAEVAEPEVRARLGTGVLLVILVEKHAFVVV